MGSSGTATVNNGGLLELQRERLRERDAAISTRVARSGRPYAAPGTRGCRTTSGGRAWAVAYAIMRSPVFDLAIRGTGEDGCRHKSCAWPENLRSRARDLRIRLSREGPTQRHDSRHQRVRYATRRARSTINVRLNVASMTFVDVRFYMESRPAGQPVCTCDILTCKRDMTRRRSSVGFSRS